MASALFSGSPAPHNSAQNSTHVMRLLWLVVMVVLSMVVHNSNAMKEDTALALHTNCRCLIVILVLNIICAVVRFFVHNGLNILIL